MSDQQFVHLHVHSEYSLLDGISSISSLVKSAAALEMPALAITDHGNLHGAVDFYSECRDAGIKPIIGCELYVAHDTIESRGAAERSPHHLTVLAANRAGYANLVSLVTESHHRGFYQKPRVDRDLLQQHSDGLIVLSGCPSAELPGLLSHSASISPTAMDAFHWYRDTFPDRYFLEIQRHTGIDNLETINHNLIRLAQQTGVPLVATNDSHYTSHDDHDAHDLFLAVQTGKTLNDKTRLKFSDDSYYLKPPDQMAALFDDLPQAVGITTEIAQSCDLDLQFENKRLPAFPTPDGTSADQYLETLCRQGFEAKHLPDTDEYRSRLDYELEVIRQTRFADYFLIIWDIVRFTRRAGILIGVRGSAAASLVLHCLDITAADPLLYGLVFERFLNVERKEMPDIDLDLQDDRRDEALNYAIDTYGKHRVAQIATFSRFGPKSALKAAAKAKGMPFAESDRIAQMIPPKSRSVLQAVRASPDLQEAQRENPELEDLFKRSEGIVHVVNHTGVHAAGIVISDEPLATIAPLQPTTDRSGQISVTQFDMEAVAKTGLLKMDFLGLTNLTILDQVIRDSPDAPDRLEDIPLDDPDTYRLLRSGHTSNVFQLESSGMQHYISELAPQKLGDISAMIALYRPGPVENIDRFIQSKHGRVNITYPHSSMQELLDETYGIIVYQDQVLRIMQDFAGYTLGKADIVRKAMGKKIPKLMIEERENFVQGSIKQGYRQNDAEAIFDLIEPFAGYAFNKAHSISYALLSYWTAYFKAHHPRQYMAAVLNCRQHQSKDLYRIAISECRRMGLAMRPPSVNHSRLQSAPEGDQAIRMGLTAVNGIGNAAAAAIVNERESNGPYASFEDFLKRCDVTGMNARQFENMLEAGALDDLVERGHAVKHSQPAWNFATAATAARNSSQSSMFDTPGANLPPPDWITPPDNHQPATPRQKSSWEVKTLGLPISSNTNGFSADYIVKMQDIENASSRDQVTVAGVFSSLQKRVTRDNKPYTIATLNLDDGSIEVMLWQNVLEQTHEDLIQPWAAVAVTGRATRRDEAGFSLSADTVFDPERNAPTKQPVFVINSSGDGKLDRQRMMRCLNAVIDYPGDQPTRWQLRDGDSITTIELPSLTIDSGNAELQSRIAAILGSSDPAIC